VKPQPKADGWRGPPGQLCACPECSSLGSNVIHGTVCDFLRGFVWYWWKRPDEVERLVRDLSYHPRPEGKCPAHGYDTMLGDGKGWRCGRCGAIKPD